MSEWESLEAIFFSYRKWLEWCFTWNIVKLGSFEAMTEILVNLSGVSLQLGCLNVCGMVGLQTDYHLGKS